MSQETEKDIDASFRREVRRRQSSKLRKKAFFAGLGAIAVGAIYCLQQGLFVALVALVLLAIALLLLLAKQQVFERYWYRFSLRGFSPTYLGLPGLRQSRGKYVLGLVVLAIALAFHLDPALITAPMGNLASRILYNPQPPTVSSPWPWQGYGNLHPAIAHMPPEAEASIPAVAAYIVREETDPWLRVKAIHDYVVSRVDYDTDILRDGSVRPRQDARTVFRTHEAVCEGYARLFGALGKAMGMNVAYVTGTVRRDLAPAEVIPPLLRFTRSDYDWTRHAWNAIEVEGQWYLVDTTWDDAGDDLPYESEYLLIPPTAAIVSHRPEQSVWQLLPRPIGRAAFEAQPMLSPQFFAEGLALQDPSQYRTTVRGTASIQMNVPAGYDKEVVARFTRLEQRKFSFLDLSGAAERPQGMQACEVESASERVRVTCPFPNPGDYQVAMFVLTQEPWELQPVGQLKFKVRS